MNLAKMQSDVEDFHRTAGVQVGDLAAPAIPGHETQTLRLRLIEEELRELAAALAHGDLIGAADALGDLLYVTIGAGVTFGLDLQPIWDAIHHSNMDKFPGGVVIRRADGKILKPEGWRPPDLSRVIREQIIHYSLHRATSVRGADDAFDWSDSGEDTTVPFVGPGREP